MNLMLLVPTMLTTPRPRLPRTCKNMLRLVACRQVEITRPTSELLKLATWIKVALLQALGSVPSRVLRLVTSPLSRGWAALQAMFSAKWQSCSPWRAVPPTAVSSMASPARTQTEPLMVWIPAEWKPTLIILFLMLLMAT